MKKLLTILMCLLLSSSILATERITLTEQNHILIRGQVNAKSMAKASLDILKMDQTLKVGDPIFIVIDSGGGSVFAGLNFIQTIGSIDRPVHTVGMFSFSMAFSIFQRGDTRYVLANSIIGQHRAKGGFQGQFATGEVEQRLGLWTDIIFDLNKYEAGRMGISIETFRSRTKDEMYLYGEFAVGQRGADELAILVCSPELLEGTLEVSNRSPFGSSVDTFSKCPLIRASVKSE